MANLDRIETEGVTVLTLHGSLGVQELDKVQPPFHDLAHRPNGAVVVDLSNVDFLATPAIAMLLETAQSVRNAGGRMAVCGAQPRVVEVLHRLHLDTLLPVCGTTADAITLVRTPQPQTP